VLRFLLWRVLAVVSGLAATSFLLALLDGSVGRDLRGKGSVEHLTLARLAGAPIELISSAARGLPGWSGELAAVSGFACLAAMLLSVALRWRARERRDYTRLRVLVYRADSAESLSVARMFAALHAGLAVRWWRRLIAGQPSVSVETHYVPPGTRSSGEAWLAITCPSASVSRVESALRAAYPNARLGPVPHQVGAVPALLRLKKHRAFVWRAATVAGARFEREPQPAMNRLLTAMAAGEQPCFTQIALTPAPAVLERIARGAYKAHESRLSRERREHAVVRDRSFLDDTELRGGLEIQHRSLFFTDIRVVAPTRGDCERVAAALRTERGENRLVERGTNARHSLFGLYGRRIVRGEGNPIPSPSRGVMAPLELAELWQLPAVDFSTVPFSRDPLPLAPAPPEIYRPTGVPGTLRDAVGPVSIHPELRRQNTAVPGTVEQGKSSYLVASVAEDLRRERCAVIVLDPKGDAAEAALSAVPSGRICTLLDFADPTCGFNPLAVDAPADVIADYVVSALKNLFTDADIRASSDRYLRNAIIAVLSSDPGCTLWDAARLLSVGEEGYAYRRAIGARVRALPELKEISAFFTSELSAQLADAKSATTSKLDAPVNKLARLLNSPSIKRILLNDSLPVDFDRVIAGGEVLIVKGALGVMGAGNTSVVMQLLIGMLDAALARQQDLVPAGERVAVALKIDEAPLVLNRGFAETMALKRSAGLETVACWQTDAQWVDREVRDQLDALFAHRVYFATASARDSRAATELTMAEFSDTVRPGIPRLGALGHPDVRLRLPRHHAIVSWTTPQGRQSAFVAETLPLRIDRDRVQHHAAAQAERGGQRMSDLRQPHWGEGATAGAPSVSARPPAGWPEDEPPTSAEALPQSPPLQPGNTGSGDARAPDALAPSLPTRLADSYRELLDLDRASRARRAPRTVRAGELELDSGDADALRLIGTFDYLLTTQLHRRLAPHRAVTTTQRRLKRLADHGLVERFQFHKPDGGGVPMCYALSVAGLACLEAQLERDGRGGTAAIYPPAPWDAADEAGGSRRARRQMHAAGWALALAGLVQARALRGAGESVLVPPRGKSSGGSGFGPGDLRLPGGRTAHDFLRTPPSGERVDVERFETLRPDATVTCTDAATRAQVDVFIELDDRHESPAWVNKLERYDHFLTGWSAQTRRYGGREAANVVVAFACRDRERARACARRADAVLCACRAYAGDYPQSWEYLGREHIVFLAERDIHEGNLCAWGTSRLPPAVRVAAASGDPSAAEALAQPIALPVAR
jgi:Replication-relaxation